MFLLAKKIILLSFLGITCSFSVYAQLVDTILQYPSVEITASRLESFQTGTTITDLDSSLRQISPAQHLGTLLSLNSSAFIKNYGPGRLSSISIRGASAAQTGVIWNGFNLNNPLLGQTDFSLIPAFLVDHVDVQLSSNSASWGSGSIGGAIILTNRHFFSQGREVAWKGAIGSFGNNFNGLNVGYSTDKWTTGIKVFFQTGKNDFPIKNGQTARLMHSQLSQWGLLHKSGVRFRQNQQLDLNIWYQSSDRNLPPTLLQQTSVASQEDESLRSGLNWKLTGKQSVLQVRSGFFYQRLFYTDDRTDLFSNSETWTFQQEVEWNKSLSPQQNLLIGAQHVFTKAQSFGFGDRKPSQNRIAAFGMYKWTSPTKNWKTQFSLRQDWLDGRRLPLIPAISFEGKVNNALLLYGNISRSYRVPTFNDFFWQFEGKRDLLPEEGLGAELGLVYGSAKIIKGTLSFYNRNINNWIIWTPINSVWIPQNLNKVWSRGMEGKLNGEKQIGNIRYHWSLGYDLSYSTNQRTNKSNNDLVGRQLIYVPNNKFSGSFGAQLNQWELSWYHLYTGKVFTLADNSDYLSAYHLDHLSLSKEFKMKKRKGGIFFKWNNIFGKNYQVVAFYPMPLQNFELGWHIK